MGIRIMFPCLFTTTEMLIHWMSLIYHLLRISLCSLVSMVFTSGMYVAMLGHQKTILWVYTVTANEMGHGCVWFNLQSLTLESMRLYIINAGQLHEQVVYCSIYVFLHIAIIALHFQLAYNFNSIGYS